MSPVLRHLTFLEEGYWTCINKVLFPLLRSTEWGSRMAKNHCKILQGVTHYYLFRLLSIDFLPTLNKHKIDLSMPKSNWCMCLYTIPSVGIGKTIKGLNLVLKCKPTMDQDGILTFQTPAEPQSHVCLQTRLFYRPQSSQDANKPLFRSVRTFPSPWPQCPCGHRWPAMRWPTASCSSLQGEAATVLARSCTLGLLQPKSQLLPPGDEKSQGTESS